MYINFTHCFPYRCESEERADDITVIVGKVKHSKSKGGVLEKLRSMIG